MTLVHNLSILYYACDSNCLSAASWTATTAVPRTLTLQGPSSDEFNYFAVGPSGQAAIFFFSSDGVAVARCASACSVATHWSNTRIAPSLPLWKDVQVLFTPAGGLAVSTMLVNFNQTPSQHAAYFQCAATDDCALGTSWKGILFDGTGADSRQALAFDTQGRPRVAVIYVDVDPQLFDKVLLWSCDTACTDPTRWSKLDLGLTAGGTTAYKRIGFDAGNFTVGTLPDNSVVLGGDVDAVSDSQLCNGALRFEWRSLVSVIP